MNEHGKQLGGGLANEMRALGYTVRPPSDPEDGSCWEMVPPGDGNQIWLAKDEAEGWEKASEHWHAQASKAALRTPSSNPVDTVGAEGVEPWGYGWYELGGKKMASGYLPTIDFPRSESVSEGPFPLYRILAALSRQPVEADGEGWQFLRQTVTPPPFWHNEQAWRVMWRMVSEHAARLSTTANPKGDAHG